MERGYSDTEFDNLDLNNKVSFFSKNRWKEYCQSGGLYSGKELEASANTANITLNLNKLV